MTTKLAFTILVSLSIGLLLVGIARNGTGGVEVTIPGEFCVTEE